LSLGRDLVDIWPDPLSSSRYLAKSIEISLELEGFGLDLNASRRDLASSSLDLDGLRMRGRRSQVSSVSKLQNPKLPLNPYPLSFDSNTKTSLFTQNGCGKCLGYQPLNNLDMEK